MSESPRTGVTAKAPVLTRLPRDLRPEPRGSGRELILPKTLLEEDLSS